MTRPFRISGNLNFEVAQPPAQTICQNEIAKQAGCRWSQDEYNGTSALPKRASVHRLAHVCRPFHQGDCSLRWLLRQGLIMALIHLGCAIMCFMPYSNFELERPPKGLRHLSELATSAERQQSLCICMWDVGPLVQLGHGKLQLQLQWPNDPAQSRPCKTGSKLDFAEWYCTTWPQG